MSFNRRTILDLVAIPIGLAAFGALCWFAIYAGPTSADKLEARFESEAITALSEPQFRWARVEMNGQTAIISGTAPTEALHQRAIRRVKEAAGPGGWLEGGVIAVEDAIYVLPPLRPYRFQADKLGDRLLFSGVLPGVDALDRLEDSLPGIGFSGEASTDALSFRDGMPDGDWMGAALLGLEQLLRLRDGEMELVGKRLTVSGQAPDSDTRIDITLRLTRPPSGFATNADIIGDAVWTAKLANGVLKFSGNVPDASERSELVKQADRIFDGEVINEMGVAPMPQSDWTRAVERALPLFLEFQSGTMLFKGDELEIRGKAGTSVLEYLREDLVRTGSDISVNLTADDTPIALEAFLTAPDTGELPSREVCQAALDEALWLGPINFEYAKDELSRSSGKVLDGVLTVMQSCPQFIFQVDAATHAQGRRIALQKLTSDRQMAFASYFIAHGVPVDQIELTEVISDGSGVTRSGNLDPDRQLTVRIRE